MGSILPSGYDPQASLDAALFASTGGAPASSDPAVDALETIGGSYGNEIAFLQQQLQPSRGAYDASGSPTATLEGALSSLLGGGTAWTPVDEQLLGGAPPMPAYGQGGSLLGGGQSLVDLLG